MSKQYCIAIEGMGCAHCVKSVTEALTAIGASVSHVEIGLAEAVFDGDTAVIQEAIEARGFDVSAITEA